ncbi:glycosyltransferase [Campylobacter molothri]|uniref:glycosyltransferase n=1 Tax=Campylobacter molothri TaxID=1032242 RepID=UPI00301C7092|nr:glycosyltransferase [Campylobacter sp. RM10538]
MKLPLVSVIMPCYNRQEYIIEAIESILNQTYTNFEFIIIDDCSTDNTYEIVKKYAEIDKRIIALKNEKNQGIVYTLNRGLNIAQGKYIARMDDDDISLPSRFEKQVEYMEANLDIVVLGSFIEVFNEKFEECYSWVCEDKPEILSILLNFFNPMCHPSIMMRKEFLTSYNLKYEEKYRHAEEYFLWTEILKYGGKIANIPEVLLRYRRHSRSVTSVFSKKQAELTAEIQKIQLQRFFNAEEIECILKDLMFYPFTYNKINKLYSIFSKMQDNDKSNIYSLDAYNKTIEKYCGRKSDIHIFFMVNDSYVQHCCTCLASILVNSTPLDNFYFYIISDRKISDSNKKNIFTLKTLKEFHLEFLDINANHFEHYLSIEKSKHIFLETYCKYIIARLKPNLNRCLYLDCDIIVEDSLNLLYNTDIKDNYIGAVLEFCSNALKYHQNEQYFNLGVLLFDLIKWREKEIDKKIFFIMEVLKLQNKFTYQDQDVLNFVLKNKWFMISPFYNAQYFWYLGDRCKFYSEELLFYAKKYPKIIHYSSHVKPWTNESLGKIPIDIWKKYWSYLKLTPFKCKYYTEYQQNINRINMQLYGAANRIKNQLSYRIGTILVNSKTLFQCIKAPYKIIKVIYQYKKENQIYRILIQLDSKFKLKPLEDYIDYYEALLVKEHLSYRVGNLFIKHPFTFVFRIFKEYKKWKNKH